MPEKWILRQYQSLPLIAKVHMSQNRIREWYNHWNGDVCVSFSGGKDSTVLAHLVHEYFPDVPLVFANTGLEYPEIQAFARKMGAEFVRPKMSFSDVISTYGYPIISKENAEAIYYARRIRNSVGGGYATTGRKRNEINGSRTFGGGVLDSSSRALNTDEISSKAATETGKTLKNSDRGVQASNETYRRRADITNERNLWEETRQTWNNTTQVPTVNCSKETEKYLRSKHQRAELNGCSLPYKEWKQNREAQQTGMTGDEELLPG